MYLQLVKAFKSKTHVAHWVLIIVFSRTTLWHFGELFQQQGIPKYSQ